MRGRSEMQERWMGNARVVRKECKGRSGVQERQVRNARAVDGECKSG